MARHKGRKRWLKYPVAMYKHWLLNNWYFFTLPKIKNKLKGLK
jgi:hypothetical protein